MQKNVGIIDLRAFVVTRTHFRRLGITVQYGPDSAAFRGRHQGSEGAKKPE